jgi:hypothetical protein
MRVYDRERNTAYHRARREAHRASFAGQPLTISLEDDSNDTVTRLHRGCGARVFGMPGHYRCEVIRCERGHRVRAGDWTIARVQAVESRQLPAADVGDRIVVEVLA